MRKKSVDEKRQQGLIALCWLVYTAAYLGRYNYTANILLIQSAFAATHADAAFASTLFFFAYGVGQVVNGLLCRFYPKRSVLAISLMISAVLNLVIGAGAGFSSFCYLWLANGAVQSVLWSSLLAVLSERLDARHLKHAVLAMGTTTPAGTLLAYGSSALLALTHNFRWAFVLAAAVLAIVAVVWFCCYNRFAASAHDGIEKKQERQSRRKGGIGAGLVVMLGVLALFAVVNNLVKDGLTTWVPSLLSEAYGLDDSLSIILTLVLPVVGLFGTALATALHRAVKDFIGLATIFFGICLVVTGGTIALLGTPYWGLLLLCLGAVTLLMTGINNVVTSIAPLYLRTYCNSGALTGVLNGFCYLGSTLAAYGLGLVVDRSGWDGIFYLFLWLIAGMVVLGIVYLVVQAIVRAVRKHNTRLSSERGNAADVSVNEQKTEE